MNAGRCLPVQSLPDATRAAALLPLPHVWHCPCVVFVDMRIHRLGPATFVLALALTLTGCRDWETAEWRATPLEVSGFVGGHLVADGEPELVSAQLSGESQWLEVGQVMDDGTVVSVRLLPSLGLRPVVVGESDVGLDVEVRVQRDGVWTEQPPAEAIEVTQLAASIGRFAYEDTARTDRYTARVRIAWPSRQEEVVLTLDLEQDLTRPEPSSDDDDDFDDDFDEDWDWDDC